MKTVEYTLLIITTSSILLTALTFYIVYLSFIDAGMTYPIMWTLGCGIIAGMMTWLARLAIHQQTKE